MQFIVKAYDGPDMLKKRMEVRPRHLEGMDKLKEHIICAGGLMDEEGKLWSLRIALRLILILRLSHTL